MKIAILLLCLLASAAAAAEPPRRAVNPRAAPEATATTGSSPTTTTSRGWPRASRSRSARWPPPPTLETLAAQPRWVWFMPWGNLAFWGNGPERLKALLASDRVLTREQVKRGEDGVSRIEP